MLLVDTCKLTDPCWRYFVKQCVVLSRAPGPILRQFLQIVLMGNECCPCIKRSLAEEGRRVVTVERRQLLKTKAGIPNLFQRPNNGRAGNHLHCYVAGLSRLRD